MEELTEENDLPTLQFNPQHGQRSTSAPVESNIVPHTILLSEDELLSSDSSVTPNLLATLDSNNSLYSIFNNRSTLVHNPEEISGFLSVQHSVQNYSPHFQYPSFLSNSVSNYRDLFYLQRQMLYDMGVLYEQNSLEQFSGFRHPDIHMIPTRQPLPFGSEANSRASKRKALSGQATNRFVIFKQPDTVQRRSYSKEKRYVVW